MMSWAENAHQANASIVPRLDKSFPIQHHLSIILTFDAILSRYWKPRYISSYKKTAGFLLHAGFLFSLTFDPEDGVDLFLLNVGRVSPDFTELYSILYAVTISHLHTQTVSYNDEARIFPAWSHHSISRRPILIVA
jgi:hypothetical protein